MTDAKEEKTNDEISAEATVRAITTVHSDITNEEIDRLVAETEQAVLYDDSEGNISIAYPNGTRAVLNDDFSQHPQEYINNETALRRIQALTDINRDEVVLEAGELEIAEIEAAGREQESPDQEQAAGTPQKVLDQEYIKSALDDLKKESSQSTIDDADLSDQEKSDNTKPGSGR